MVRIIKGRSSGRGRKINIVIAQFNEFITKRLLDGCLNELARLGVKKNDITIVWVPGAYEIPVVALRFAKKKNVHAVICLGAVIRGETIHFDLVTQGVAKGVMQASLMSGTPIIFGILAVDTVDQAYKRSEKKGDNKGCDAALTAIEMIDVLKQVARTK